MGDPDPNTLKQIMAELRDVNKDKRRTAVMKLGMVGGDQAVRALIRLVEDEYEDLIVRGRAAIMLGNIKDQRAFESLIRALDAPGFQTPFYAAEALGKLGDPRAIPYLLNIVINGRDKTRDAAITALTRLGYTSEDETLDSMVEM